MDFAEHMLAGGAGSQLLGSLSHVINEYCWPFEHSFGEKVVWMNGMFPFG